MMPASVESLDSNFGPGHRYQDRAKAARYQRGHFVRLCVAAFLRPHSSCQVLHHVELAIGQSRCVLQVMPDAMRSKGSCSAYLHRLRGQVSPARYGDVHNGTPSAMTSTHHYL